MMRAFLAIGVLLTAVSALAVMPATDQFVPALAHAGGYGGAQWRGDVWIYNPASDRAATVEIDLLLRQPNPNPASQTITLQPGETMYFQDIVGTGLFQQSAAGGIRVVSSNPVVVTARSYDANVTTSKGTGTSGQFFGGVPATLAVGAGDATDVIGLDQDPSGTTAGFRSNLALVETTGNTVDFVIDRIDPDGTVIGSLACDGSNDAVCAPLGPWEVRQLDLVLTKFSPPSGANQRLHIRITGGSGRLIAAGSRIDNITGDPSTVEMAGGGRVGTYLCKLERSDYESPLTLTVDQGAVTALDATILFTDADVTGCSNFQVLRLSGPLATPVAYDDAGNFNFVASDAALGTTLQVNGTITVTGTVSGNATVTVSGVPGCSGSKSWPLVGARLP